MKALYSILILLLIQHVALGKSPLKSGFLVVCGDDKVLIIDPKKSNEKHIEIVWAWQVSDAKNLPVEYYTLLGSLDECKPVMNNSKLLLTGSNGASALLDIRSKQIEFYAKTPMAHSIDLLPNNRVAIANSLNKNGNSLEVYDLKQSEKVLFKDTLYSGHGAVWNEKQQLLYVLGYQMLKAYALENWNSDTPGLRLKNTWKLPERNGHDLSRIDSKRLLITTHHNVFEFNTITHGFKVFKPLENKIGVKSANYSPRAKAIAYTIAEESWWTHNIYLLNPDKKIHISHINLYKVRVAP